MIRDLIGAALGAALLTILLVILVRYAVTIW